MVPGFIEREVTNRIAEYLGGPDATERATAAVTVIGGLIFTRYLNPTGAAAAMSAADLRRILAPALRAALSDRQAGAQAGAGYLSGAPNGRQAVAPGWRSAGRRGGIGAAGKSRLPVHSAGTASPRRASS